MAFSGQNQLQFNLASPPMASRLAVRFQKPEPIKFEKLRYIDAGKDASSDMNEQFEFSSISQERMSLAVQMAKRDVRKQNQQQNTEQKGSKLAPRSRSPSPKASRSKTKIIHGKAYWDRQRKWQNQIKKPLRIKEHDRNKEARATETQTPPRLPSMAFTRNHLPATTNSPPTRDTDRYPLHKCVVSHTEAADEVEKLQLEMEGYLHQIQFIEEKAINEQNVDFLHQTRSRKKEGYLSDEEDDGRRLVRADEHATRAARNIYHLRQQVRHIQREVMNLGSDKAKHTKKSQAMAKLAAAHRGAVRAIQTFVTQLPNQDLKRGLPPTYQELALLIRQLTQLSSEIKQNEHSKVQQELTSMLDNVEKLNNAWCKNIQDQAKLQEEQQKHCRVSQEPFESDVQHRQKQTRGRGKENKPRGVFKKSVKGWENVRQTRHQPLSSAPERKTVLRAGLEALIRDSETRQIRDSETRQIRDSETRQIRDSDTRQAKDGMAWSVPLGSRPPEKKGFLLPTKLQAKREKIQKVHFHPTVPSDSHFADPTISANLKAVTTLRNPITDEDGHVASPSSSPRRRSFSHSPSRSQSSPPPWKPPCSPNRSFATEHRSRSTSPPRLDDSNRMLVQDGDQDLVKQLFPADGSRHYERGRRRKQFPFSKSPRSPVPQRQKDDIKENDFETYSHTGMERYHDQNVDDNALANQLLDDILTDTANELQQFEREQNVNREAIGLQDMPTLNNMHMRLEQMEQEQNEIRRRWTSVTFENPAPKTNYFSTNELLSDRPRSPPGIEVSRIASHDIETRPLPFAPQAVADPVIFTKIQPPTVWQEKFVHSREQISQMEPQTIPSFRRPVTHLGIPQTVVERITNNKENFERHLKKMSHHPFGKFDPWKLVEEITDQLMDECFKDVADEMEDMSEAIANNMYKSEFMLTDGQSPGSGPAGEEEVLADNVINDDEWESQSDSGDERQSEDLG